MQRNAKERGYAELTRIPLPAGASREQYCYGSALIPSKPSLHRLTWVADRASDGSQSVTIGELIDMGGNVTR